MANTSAPFGLRPVRFLSGDEWDGSANLYYVPSTDTYEWCVGDVVYVAAGGDANGIPQAALFGGSTRGTTAGAGGGAISSGAARGVIVGIGSAAGTPQGSITAGFDPNDLTATRIPATKTRDYYVWVADHPFLVFETQADTIATSAFNKNMPYYVSGMKAATSAVALSESYAQGSAANTTATLPLRCVGGPNRVNNDFTSPGTSAKIYVMLNTHDMTNGATGLVGV